MLLALCVNRNHGKLVVEQAIVQALNELEESGDIVVATTMRSQVASKINRAVQAVSPNLLTQEEFSAIKNAVNVTWSGFPLDDWGFQTHIGLTREQLKDTLDKMGKAE
ncbi:hypothetical protein [Gynuella sp.]|uniref:hypothetical protein n=1 Tax=Gynuella sp. TaxID=2969146 RepID=UPI003D0E37A5